MKITCTWTVEPTRYKDELPFGEKGPGIIQEAKSILTAFELLSGSKFQPSEILVARSGLGDAMHDYLKDHGAPVRLIEEQPRRKEPWKPDIYAET